MTYIGIGCLGVWSRCYTLSNRANNTINALQNVTDWSSESDKNRHYGEAYQQIGADLKDGIEMMPAACYTSGSTITGHANKRNMTSNWTYT